MQGIDRSDSCVNNTSLANNSKLTTKAATILSAKSAHQRPNYSVSVYFMLMFLLLCISLLAFTYLNFSKTALKERKKDDETNQYELSPTIGTIGLSSVDNEYGNDLLETNSDLNSQVKILDDLDQTRDHTKPLTIGDSNEVGSGASENFISNKISRQLSLKHKREIKALMFITFFTSFVNYGYLSSFLSYSTIPYGNTYFYLSINLSKFSAV